jgi:hypothetical protein
MYQPPCGLIKIFGTSSPILNSCSDATRYERVRAVQKTGETTRDMWHKADWDQVAKDPESIQLPREDWIFRFDAEKNAEERFGALVEVN